jgi:hypothetical protein
MVWSPDIHASGFFNHFVEPGTVTFGLIAIGLLAGIPMLAMLFIGTKLVFRYKTNNAAIGLSMVGVWLVALVALITVSASEVGNFKSRSSITKNEVISCDSCQTLYLELGEDKYEDYAEMDWEIENMKVVSVNGDEVLLGQPKLDIEKSGNENFTVQVKKTSRGKNREGAKAATEDILYNFEVNDSTLRFDPYFIIKQDGKWRGQEIEITVKVPEGKSVFLADDMEEIIHDIDNVSNTWDGDMVGKFWEMKPEGLTKKEPSK